MKYPDTFFTETHAKALAIITHEGLLGDFPKYDGSSRTHIKLIKHVSNPTHWILAVHQIALSDPEKTGYIVTASQRASIAFAG